MHIIDLRSDTVTKPSEAMRKAMACAPVGDDVYRDDPTVNKLETYAAELLGFEATIFTPSGTQANLIGILAHCGRGDEYIVGQGAHTYRYEGGGAAVLGSVQPQPIEFETDSTLSLAKVEEKSNRMTSISPGPASSAWKTPRTARPCRSPIWPRREPLPRREASNYISTGHG